MLTKAAPPKRVLCLALAACLLPWLLPAAASGARLHDVPGTITQPDGTVLRCWFSGDEFDHRMHDASGYVIVQDPATRWYVYARSAAGEIVPTGYVVGRTDPSRVDLTPGLRRPAAEVMARRDLLRRRAVPSPQPLLAQTAGTMNNISIFIRFADETEFGEAVSHYDSLFNAQGETVNSLSHYYQVVSYGQLDIRTTFYPQSADSVLSYQDSHPRSYFQPRTDSNPDGYANDNDGVQRLHTMFAAAVQAVAGSVDPNLNLDLNNDGEVDNVCFIVRGTADSWTDLLWPHMWQLQTSAFIHGKRVSNYDLQLQDFINTPQEGVGVLCHEMFHSLGAPDLYHYSQNYRYLSPVGAWDLMEDNANPPQEMDAYMKYRYGGWIRSIPSISSSGVYSLRPLTSATRNCYRIDSPRSTTEYFVIEYRSRSSSIFESRIPGDGLLVYRINTTITNGTGNADGPPDEVYIYRPGGTLTLNGQIDSANFSEEVARTTFGDDTDPSDWLSDGSTLGGIGISEIGAAGDSITFRVSLPGDQPVCTTVTGDANGDGAVNVLDLAATVNDILHLQPLPQEHRACADLDGNLQVDASDLYWMVLEILYHTPPLPQAAGRAPAGAGMADRPPVDRASPGSGPVSWSLDSNGPYWRFRLPGSRLGAFSLAVPRAPGDPGIGSASSEDVRLEGAGADAHFAWSAVDDTCRVVAYSGRGAPLGKDRVTVEIPHSLLGTAGGGAPPRCVLVSPTGERLALDPVPSVDDGPAGGSRTFLSCVSPSPASAGVEIEYSLATAGEAGLFLFDASGREVRVVGRQWQGAGPHTVSWDGKDEAGRPVPAGVYFVRLESGGKLDSRRLLIIH